MHKVRIPRGEFSCHGDTIAAVIENLMIKGLKIIDLAHVTIEFDDSGYYYTSDRPTICVSWPDLY